MILTARYVRRGRLHRVCDWCERVLSGAHIYLYGAPDPTDRPSALRLHPTERCCPNHNGDPKVAAALAAAESENNERPII